MKWDAEALVQELGSRPRGMNMSYENELLHRFPPYCSVKDVLHNRMPILRRPGIITDAVGRILAWALPGILTTARQVCSNSFLC